jgi:hypothetical protein
VCIPPHGVCGWIWTTCHSVNQRSNEMEASMQRSRPRDRRKRRLSRFLHLCDVIHLQRLVTITWFAVRHKLQYFLSHHKTVTRNDRQYVKSPDRTSNKNESNSQNLSSTQPMNLADYIIVDHRRISILMRSLDRHSTVRYWMARSM